MGKVDFQLNTTVKSADEAIRAAERSTGFRCVRQGCDDQFIDLLIPRSAIAELRESDIPGLLEVHPLDKHTVRASYDPLVIGARALVDRMCQMSGGLAPPKGDTALLHGQKRLCDHFMKTILASALTVPVVVLAWGPVDVEEELKAQVSLVLASLAQLIAVPEFYIPSMTALVRNGALEMDMLVVISITAAYVYSVVAFVFRMVDEPLAIPEFFETSTLLITLILLGRLIASYARARAIQAVSLRSLQPTTALIVEDDNLREIDSRLLQLGDCFKLLPHCQVPTDGVIIQGHSEVDESMITGENLFVKKAPGMGVIAGTMNGSGSLTARLTRLPGKNTVSDIAGLVEEATKSRPRIQDLADRVASYFVPAVSGVAIAVFVIWTIVNLKVIQAPTNKAVAGAITYTVAVLAVSCPCALGLAVPMVLVVAAGIAARGGVVIKSAESIVRSRAVTDVVFDKTGTITETKLDVAAYETFTRDAHEALALTRALVRETDHPVSTAVNRLLKSMGVRAAVTSENRSIPGDGVLALHGDAVVKAGNPTWTLSEHHPAVAKAVRDGLTVMSVTSDDALIALFALRTRLRADARSVIEDLRRRNIAVHLVSGDQQAAVESVASEVGIPIENTAAQKSPTEKQSYVSALMAENKTVLFCGDGTNDAVAVAQADVGVQLGGSSLLSSAVTRGAADVVLLSGLSGLPHLLDISGSAYRRMVFNFVWSGVYNVVAILMAAGAFVHVRIPPAYAGLGELVSVLPVVLVATTILLHKPPPAA
ncbi:P-type cation-transporting ATPase-like protein [Hapsidospora chrysogenum ATCC 11550]|uniref:P-type cation-transporting ATPase-like protein n=1 Tax=Hapsidospora chrysogenum (strain ATCC 11550 / CBS 779.69 / DSM 880 / IAM 14645 / JCM 23072 / IMI 49137) TaxID=857340 RepID=A0A086T6J9_HAPC1|nr:P-type cation-transporting ATPase-like protein [Hapsidospora chrysogenum ATCC 11550]